MPYSANIIALAFVHKGIQTGKFVTQMKLQKMVYFAHGYHLARFGKPLIVEKFQAWKFGPVVPSIYQAYKLYGSQPITTMDAIALNPHWGAVFLDDQAKEAVEYTWKVTENVTAEALSNWTHQPNSPWFKVYDSDKDAIPIDNELIEEYFKVLITKTNGRATTAGSVYATTRG